MAGKERTTKEPQTVLMSNFYAEKETPGAAEGGTRGGGHLTIDL